MTVDSCKPTLPSAEKNHVREGIPRWRTARTVLVWGQHSVCGGLPGVGKRGFAVTPGPAPVLPFARCVAPRSPHARQCLSLSGCLCCHR